MQPLLVHCLAGIGRSGLMCLIISAIIEVLINPTTLPDLSSLVGKLSNGRKNILRDREHFKFAFHAFLHFLKETCLKGEYLNIKHNLCFSCIYLLGIFLRFSRKTTIRKFLSGSASFFSKQ